MQSVSRIGRVAAIGAVVGAIVLVAIVLFSSGGGYELTARFQNSSQLVKGNLVQIGGHPVGSVKDIALTPNGQAEVTFSVDDEVYSPLREGTKAVIRQTSLSGIANRYIDLQLPPGPDADNPAIADGGDVTVDDTTSQVDLDEIFNTLDPITRVAVQDFFQGGERMLRGSGEEARKGIRYLNPALSTTSRLFRELNEDTPVLEGFIADSARLVSAVAERRDDLAALIGNLNATTRALGSERVALADAISRFPDFMRSANTTFVNLRTTLDDLDPLVNASKPVVRRPGRGNDLQELLPEARRFIADAEPTVADLDRVVKHRGSDNDLVDLTDTFPPLASTALDRRPRTVAPGGRKFKVNGGRPVPGAFPQLAEALRKSSDEIAQGRPYTPALFGWFDDFSTTGAGNDALGGISRAQVNFNATTFAGGNPITLENLGLDFGPLNPVINPLLVPVLAGAGLVEPGEELIIDRSKLFEAGLAQHQQFKRCPGGADPVAKDRSNVLSGAEQRKLDCLEEDRAVGNLP